MTTTTTTTTMTCKKILAYKTQLSQSGTAHKTTSEVCVGRILNQPGMMWLTQRGSEHREKGWSVATRPCFVQKLTCASHHAGRTGVVRTRGGEPARGVRAQTDEIARPGCCGDHEPPLGLVLAVAGRPKIPCISCLAHACDVVVGVQSSNERKRTRYTGNTNTNN